MKKKIIGLLIYTTKTETTKQCIEIKGNILLSRTKPIKYFSD